MPKAESKKVYNYHIKSSIPLKVGDTIKITGDKTSVNSTQTTTN